jgi:hypothetical protein
MLMEGNLGERKGRPSKKWLDNVQDGIMKLVVRTLRAKDMEEKFGQGSIRIVQLPSD